MDVSIDEVGRYYEACRQLRHQSVDTPMYLSVTFLTFTSAWRLESWPIVVFGGCLAFLAIRSSVHQYRSHRAARQLEPRVQMFVRFYNQVGRGQAVLDEVA